MILWGPGADRPQAPHRFLEASRYSFADRGVYLADPAYFDVPLSGLLSDSFAAERRALITDQAADAEPAFIASPEAQVLSDVYGHTFTRATPDPPAEIGAATGIELLDRDRFLAAAEPVRRGGGSAMVVDGR